MYMKYDATTSQWLLIEIGLYNRVYVCLKEITAFESLPSSLDDSFFETCMDYAENH